MTGAEPGWWLPFGQRQVERILPAADPLKLREMGIHYVVVEDDTLQAVNQTIAQWAGEYRGEVVKELDFAIEPGSPPGQLYLVHL